MNKSYSKIRHIQESNIRLEKRILNEQESGVDLINKTISIFKDNSLSDIFATIIVKNVELGDNQIKISFNGIKGGNDMSIINDMVIKCNSNLVTMTENTAGFGGGGSSKQITGYVSKKLVDHLKPFICNSNTQQQKTKPSDF
jgi:hypothetical protein